MGTEKALLFWETLGLLSALALLAKTERPRWLMAAPSLVLCAVYGWRWWKVLWAMISQIELKD
jgi:hypothetical protein